MEISLENPRQNHELDPGFRRDDWIPLYGYFFNPGNSFFLLKSVGTCLLFL